MARRRTVDGSDGAVNTMISYVPASLKDAFDKMCEVRWGRKSRSERIRDLMKKDLADWKGDANPIEFDYTTKVQEKTQMLKKEHEQRVILEKTVYSANGRGSASAFEALRKFAYNLTNTRQDKDYFSVEELEEMREKVVGYRMTGKEEFSRSDRLTFVHYLDYLIKRKTLEREIEKFLQSNNGKTIQAENVVVTDEPVPVEA